MLCTGDLANTGLYFYVCEGSVRAGPLGVSVIRVVEETGVGC